MENRSSQSINVETELGKRTEGGSLHVKSQMSVLCAILVSSFLWVQRVQLSAGLEVRKA